MFPEITARLTGYFQIAEAVRHLWKSSERDGSALQVVWSHDYETSNRLAHLASTLFAYFTPFKANFSVSCHPDFDTHFFEDFFFSEAYFQSRASLLHAFKELDQPHRFCFLHTASALLPFVIGDPELAPLFPTKLDLPTLVKSLGFRLYQPSSQLRPGTYRISGHTLDVHFLSHPFPVRFVYFDDELEQAYFFSAAHFRRFTDAADSIKLWSASEFWSGLARYGSLVGKASSSPALSPANYLSALKKGLSLGSGVFVDQLIHANPHQSWTLPPHDSHGAFQDAQKLLAPLGLTDNQQALVVSRVTHLLAASTELPSTPLSIHYNTFSDLLAFAKKRSLSVALSFREPALAKESVVQIGGIRFSPITESEAVSVGKNTENPLFLGLQIEAVAFTDRHLILDVEFLRSFFPGALHFEKGADPFRDDSAKHADFKLDDFVVHRKFGIGQFKGLFNLTVEGRASEFALLLYDEGEKLYLPVHSLGELVPYFSSSLAPKLSSLSRSDFQEKELKTKRFIRENSLKILKTYAARKVIASCVSDLTPTTEYVRFCSDFGFPLTYDQAVVLSQILDDLQSEAPSDRLICADVGFGKTEIVLRAIFQLAEKGFQTAFIVPTTTLGLQHEQTLKKRFEKYPFSVHYLSRFSSAKERRDIYQQCEKGGIDILISTHGIASDKLRFKKLGLIVVDEEHKFGAEFKEDLRRRFPAAHFISLSATPIPRTLQLVFSGVREISTIQTAPIFKKQVIPKIFEQDPALILEKGLHELARGGQIFAVCPYIRDLEEVRILFDALFPKVPTILLHAQMENQKIESGMLAFIQGEYKILITTPLMESGIDIVNANTLFIFNPERFGLSQLYQLKGRVGRGKNQGHCFLLIKNLKLLKPESRERIEIISSLFELGSGLKIALRDLEARGSGSILGFDQTGSGDEIGWDLFNQFLQEELTQLRKRASHSGSDLELDDPEIKLPFDFFFSDDTFYTPENRLDYYYRLSNCTSFKDIDALAREIRRQFGPLPEEAENMLEVCKIKLLLKVYRAKSLVSSKHSFYLTASETHLFDPSKILALCQKNPEQFHLVSNHKLRLQFPFKTLSDIFAYLRSLFYSISSLESP